MRHIRPRPLIAAGLLFAGASLMTARADALPTSAADVHPLLIRGEVPEVSVRTTDGSDFDLAAAVKKMPSIVIFYRGGW